MFHTFELAVVAALLSAVTAAPAANAHIGARKPIWGPDSERCLIEAGGQEFYKAIFQSFNWEDNSIEIGGKIVKIEGSLIGNGNKDNVIGDHNVVGDDNFAIKGDHNAVGSYNADDSYNTDDSFNTYNVGDITTNEYKGDHSGNTWVSDSGNEIIKSFNTEANKDSKNTNIEDNNVGNKDSGNVEDSGNFSGNKDNNVGNKDNNVGNKDNNVGNKDNNIGNKDSGNVEDSGNFSDNKDNFSDNKDNIVGNKDNFSDNKDNNVGNKDNFSENEHSFNDILKVGLFDSLNPLANEENTNEGGGDSEEDTPNVPRN